MEEIKKNIIKHLASIKYPGYNRDIISFGIVKDIIINGEDILFYIWLSISMFFNITSDTITKDDK